MTIKASEPRPHTTCVKITHEELRVDLEAFLFNNLNAGTGRDVQIDTKASNLASILSERVIEYFSEFFNSMLGGS